MPDWALPVSGTRDNRTNPTTVYPTVLRGYENSAARRHVPNSGSSFAFHDTNKGDYKP